jgi:peptidoglycan/LPS O-acetylase OafA/YrhL
VVLLIPTLIPMREEVMLTAFSPLFPLACAAVILHLARQGRLARPLAMRPVAYVGRISYGIYLWHFPLMHFAGVAMGLILTAVAAPASYRYVETPIRQIAKRHPGKAATTAGPAQLAASEA